MLHVLGERKPSGADTLLPIPVCGGRVKAEIVRPVLKWESMRLGSPKPGTSSTAFRSELPGFHEGVPADACRRSAGYTPAFYDSDIFVMPSLFDGFSIAALEVLASDLPAVFTGVAGLRDCRTEYDGPCCAEPVAYSLHTALNELLAESGAQRRMRSRDYPAISQRWYGDARDVTGYLELCRGR